MKNIILIVIDDLRFDALSCNEDKTYLKSHNLQDLSATRNIDKYAREGIMFTQCISVGSYTPSTHASIFTGLYPPKHGVRAFLKNPLSEYIPTIAEILRDKHYCTFASIDFLPMFHLLGLTRGFNTCVQSNDKEFFRLLRTQKGTNNFIFAHFGDVHPPYGISPCEPYEGYNFAGDIEKRKLAKSLGLEDDGDIITLSNRIRVECEKQGIAGKIQFPRYLKGVNKFDATRFKFFMDYLYEYGLLENCLLIITADHGQALIRSKNMYQYEYDKFDHGETVQEELIRVPLIIWETTKRNSGIVVNDQISQHSIKEMIIDWSEDTINYIHTNPYAYSEVYYHDRKELSKYLKECVNNGEFGEGYETFLYQQSVRNDKYKLIKTHGKDTKFVNLKYEPYERNEYREMKNCYKIRRKLESVLTQIENDIVEIPDNFKSFDIEMTERHLRALGYIE